MRKSFPPADQTITLSRLQVPPDGQPGLRHRDWAGPPDMSTFFTIPSAKNATCRPSGDQKGRKAPSLPVRGVSSRESRDRTYNRLTSSKSSWSRIVRPSGETDKSGLSDLAFSGMRIWNRIGAGSSALLRCARPRLTAAASAAAATPVIQRRPEPLRAGPDRAAQARACLHLADRLPALGRILGQAGLDHLFESRAPSSA
jgi:hypothetical protein